MKKKHLQWICIVGFVWLNTQAVRADGRVLLMVPHEEEMIKVGLDLAERHPSLLISYRLGAQNTAALKGWTGTEWVYVSVENFQSGNFFREGPDEAIIIQSYQPFPEGLIPSESWCDGVYKIHSNELRPVIHLVGQALHFKYDDWKWFEKRYDTPISQLNPTESGIHWYNRRLGDVFKGKRVSGHEDHLLWEIVRASKIMVEVPMGSEEEVQTILISDEEGKLDAPLVIEEELPEEEVNPLELDLPLAEIVSSESEA
ncbi:MAG: hypothetical protein CMF27_07495 [Kiritimatiellaceae bacterium]|jgi:hypothetical protein|nr:hypothetical protein [Kiritimatiellaceae bacterium]